MGIIWKAKAPSEADKKRYAGIAANIGNEYGVPYQVMVGVIEQESKFDPTSYRWNEDNPKDRSFGLMHLTIPTAQQVADKIFGKNKIVVDRDYLYQAANNIRLGASYLKEQFDRWGSWPKAISAYNAGRPISGNVESYVKKVIAKGAAIPFSGKMTIISLVIGSALAWLLYKKIGGKK